MDLIHTLPTIGDHQIILRTQPKVVYSTILYLILRHLNYSATVKENDEVLV